MGVLFHGLGGEELPSQLVLHERLGHHERQSGSALQSHPKKREFGIDEKGGGGYGRGAGEAHALVSCQNLGRPLTKFT